LPGVKHGISAQSLLKQVRNAWDGIDLVDMAHLGRIDGVFDQFDDLVGASNINVGLGVVLSFSPVSQFGMALPGIAFWLRLFSRHHLLSICSHDYSPHSLSPHWLVFLGNLRDVGLNAVFSFCRHCAGG